MSTESHPLGVRPLGDLFFSEEGIKLNAVIRKSMGLFSRLHDSLIFSIISMLPLEDVSRLMSTSKGFYALSSIEDIWKAGVLEKYSSNMKYGHSWKHSYICLEKNLDPLEISPVYVSCKGFHSDLVHRLWSVSHARISRRWCIDSVDAPYQIPRVSAKDLSVEDFIELYEKPNLPVIITDCVSEWPAYRKWTKEYLLSQYSNTQFHAAGFDFSLSDYFRYIEAAVGTDDAPLYLFDKEFTQKAPDMLNDFSVPPYFSDDVFSVMGESRRPDYQWLIIGGTGSGSVFHKDPNATSAYNAVLSGRKKWILTPPNRCPPGVWAANDGSELITSMSPMQWFLDYYSQFVEERDRFYAIILKTRKDSSVIDIDQGSEKDSKRRKVATAACPNVNMEKKSIKQKEKVSSIVGSALGTVATAGPVEGIVKAGEVIFVPRGYWHTVMNIDDDDDDDDNLKISSESRSAGVPSIAITQNFCSPVGLPYVLQFLKESPHAISGVNQDVEHFFDNFVEGIKNQRPELFEKVKDLIDALRKKYDEKEVAEITPWQSALKSFNESKNEKNSTDQVTGSFKFSFF